MQGNVGACRCLSAPKTLMLDQAAAVGQKLSMLGVHADVLEACVRAGEADLDNSAVIKEIRRRKT